MITLATAIGRAAPVANNAALLPRESASAHFRIMGDGKVMGFCQAANTACLCNPLGAKGAAP